MKKYVWVVCLLFMTSVSAQESYRLLSPAVFELKAEKNGVVTRVNKFLLEVSSLQQLRQQAPLTLKLQFTLPGEGNIEVDLEKKNIFDPSFVVNSATGKKENVDPGIHYTGRINGDEKSMVAFSFFRHCFYGLVANDRGNYNIVSMKDEISKNVTDRYIIYNDRDLTIPNTFSCLTEDLPGSHLPASPNHTAGMEKIVTHCKTIRQYYECDYSTFRDNGNSVANTVAFTTGMFNVIKGIYENEGIKLAISEIFVWDVEDIYPDGSVLEIFIAYADSTKNDFNGDLAQLLSTETGWGGLANLKALCLPYSPMSISSLTPRGPYSTVDAQDHYADLPAYSWTIHCSAHETGHNLGSHHTHWCGWETSPGVFSPIDTCFETEADTSGFQCYTGPAIPRTGTIMSYCHLGPGGVNLNLGFGPLPTAVMQNHISTSACISSVWMADPVLSQTGNTLVCNPDSLGAYTYQWYDDNGVLVHSGAATFNPPAAGMYKIVLTNASGCRGETTINFIPNAGTVENETFLYTLWPNPATDLVQLKWAGNHIPSGDIKIELLDMSGRAVLTKIFPEPGSSMVSFNVDGIRNGVYILRASSGPINMQSKLMIMR